MRSRGLEIFPADSVQLHARGEPQVIRYMVTSNQVILVVTPDDTVMTVLDMAEAKQWKKIRRQTLIKVRRMGTL